MKSFAGSSSVLSGHYRSRPPDEGKKSDKYIGNLHSQSGVKVVWITGLSKMLSIYES